MSPRKGIFVGNKVKKRISKRVFQENKERQIFQKTNIFYPLIRHSVHPSPLPLSAGGGGEPATKFSKSGDLTGPQILEGGCWERGG